MRLARISEHKKFIFLNYDQGLANSPKAFDADSVDPHKTLDLALEGKFTACAVHAGIAEKYHRGALTDLPLIIKINMHGSKPFTSVEHAGYLQAAAIGLSFTEFNSDQLQNLAKTVELAHEFHLPVIVWIEHAIIVDIVAHKVRACLELGVDLVVLEHFSDFAGLPWIVTCAGDMPIVIQNFANKQTTFLETTELAMLKGASGISWHYTGVKNPAALARALRELVLRRRKASEVKSLLH